MFDRGGQCQTSLVYVLRNGCLVGGYGKYIRTLISKQLDR